MLKNRITPSHLTHSLVALAAMTFMAQLQAQSLEEVKVLGGRLEQQQFDTPGSVQVIDEATIRGSGIQVNLSDTLGRVPGVVALNRNNYAQDVQISIRGFGARAPFGLRGIRLITDGIPATIPDGQGQSSTVSLTSAARIEVLTGPLAQLYGNSSGGVIQTFTREAGDKPEASAQLYGGSYGMYRADTAVSGRTGDVGIVADYSVFHTDGYRANSSADRKQLNSVITWDVKQDTRAKLIINVFDMPLAKDPAGLTQLQFDADPKQAGANTEKYRTRKIVSQNQVGTVIEHRIDQDLSLTGRIYMGERTNLGYQTNAPSDVGKWVALSREFNGVGVQLKGQKDFGGDTGLDWVVGVDYDIAKEHRTAGLTDTAMEKVATPNRDEINQASNTDLFGQVNWSFAPSWTATAGVRVSNIELKSKDDYLTDSVDGSGRVRYTATSPVLGITWHTNEALNLYANIGRGFETPTLAEVAYIKNPAGSMPIASFNTELLASSSIHKEIGSKWKINKAANLNAAYFLIDTENEIVVLQNDGGTTAFQNASKTKRDGVEISLSNSWTEQLKSQISLTSMRVKYTEAFGSALVNNYLPGIPENQVFANLTWTQNPSVGKSFVPGTVLSGSLFSRSRIYADDANKAIASEFSVINLSAQQRYKIGSMNTTVYAAVDNAADKKGVGSVIVNAAFSRFFEPALPRNYTLGVQASLPF